MTMITAALELDMRTALGVQRPASNPTMRTLGRISEGPSPLGHVQPERRPRQARKNQHSPHMPSVHYRYPSKRHDQVPDEMQPQGSVRVGRCAWTFTIHIVPEACGAVRVIRVLPCTQRDALGEPPMGAWLWFRPNPDRHNHQATAEVGGCLFCCSHWDRVKTRWWRDGFAIRSSNCASTQARVHITVSSVFPVLPSAQRIGWQSPVTLWRSAEVSKQRQQQGHCCASPATRFVD